MRRRAGITLVHPPWAVPVSPCAELSANIASNEVMIMERLRLRGREMFHKSYVLHHDNKNNVFSRKGCVSWV